MFLDLVRKRNKSTFMSKKFYSMLLSGTFSIAIVTILILSDSIIAGIFLGKDAVSAISIITPLYSLTAFFGLILSIGMPIMYSNAIGRTNEEEAINVFNSGMFYTSVIGILFFIFINLFGDDYINYFNATSIISKNAIAYLKWMKYVMLVLPLGTYVSDMVYADGDDSIVVIQSVIQAITNIALSIVLAKKVGIAGISCASFISNVFSILILSIHFFKKSNSLKFRVCKELTNLVDIFEYGIVDSCVYLFYFVFLLVINKFVIVHFGIEKISYAIIIMFIKEFTLALDGVGAAITPIMSIYMSEKSFEGVKTTWKIAKKAAIIEGALAMLFIAVFSGEILNIYDIYEVSLREVLVKGMVLVGFSFIFLSLLYLETSYFILIKKINLAVIMCAYRDILLSLPLGIILGLAFGDIAMFLGISIGGILGYFFSKHYLIRKYGKENYPLMLKDVDGKDLIIAYDVNPNEIVKARDEIEHRLKEGNVDVRTISKILLLFEECSMQIYEHNNGKKIVGEASIIISENITLIIRDSGKIMNIIDTDANISSFENYIATNIFANMSAKSKNMLTMSYNRNIFEIKRV